MKRKDQVKVLLLSFFSIGVLVAILTIVSLMTTQAKQGGHGASQTEQSGGGH